MRIIFEYRCDHCAYTFRCDVREDMQCCLRCDRMARRVWGFSVMPSFAPNFRSDLARAAEKASTPRGVWDADGNRHEVTPPEHRYVPVDMRDREALGVTSEGLDATYDRLRRDGNHPAADRLRKVMD